VHYPNFMVLLMWAWV